MHMSISAREYYGNKKYSAYSEFDSQLTVMSYLYMLVNSNASTFDAASLVRFSCGNTTAVEGK